MTIRELITRLGFRLDDAPLKEYEKKINGAKKKSEALSKTVGGIGKAVSLIGGAAATAGFAAFAKSVLDTTGEIEQYRVTLGTMIGDQEKANKVIHDLDYSPVSDFYGTAAAIGGLQGMVTFGMQAEEASDTLTRLGDIAQGSTDAFKSLSLNMGQVFAKGKADATDLRQFVTQGFDVVGEVSKITGKSRTEIEKAGVTYEQCAMALRSVTDEGGKYNGMLAKQAKTFPGVIKQFQSLSAIIKENIGTAVLDRVKELMQYFLNVGRAMQTGISSAGIKAFNVILRAIAQVIIFTEVLIMRMRKFGGAFTPIKELGKDVFGFIGSVLRSLSPLLMSLAQAFLLAFKPIQAFVRPILESLKPVFKDVFSFGADIVSRLLPVINSLTPVFSFLGKTVAAVINIFSTGISTILTGLGPVSDIILAIAGVIGGVIVAVKAWTAAQAILNAIMAANPIGLIIIAIVALVGVIALLVKNWDKVKSAAQKAFKAIGDASSKAFAKIKSIWNAIKNFFARLWGSVVGTVRSAWSGITDFFSGLWSGIVSGASSVFGGIVGAVTSVIDRIKAAWSGITDFFSGLWEALKNSPKEALQYILNAFTGVANSIKEKFLGFITAIQNAWESVKRVFGGVWESVVKFFTGGDDSSSEKDSPKKVNDLILTPDGAYSTHPDDTIFAMKDPGALIERLAELLLTAPSRNAHALADTAAAQAVRQSVSNDYSRHSSSQVFSAPISVSVNASGMTEAQARRVVESGVRGALRDAIAGSRGVIPSPEARRS